MDHCLRRSHDKVFGTFGVSRFADIAKELYNAVKSTIPSAACEVLTCEDGYTYYCSRTTAFGQEDEDLLDHMDHYSLNELDEDVWSRSDKVQFCVHGAGDTVFYLTYYRPEADRLFFYGEGLDSDVYRKVINIVFDTGWFCRLGNGISRESDL